MPDTIYKVIKNKSNKKLSIYNGIDDLPDGADTATLAYVNSTNRLYVATGTAWLPVISENVTPTWASVPANDVTILIGDTYNFTLEYDDPENIESTFTYQLSSGSLGTNTLTTNNENFSIVTNQAATFDITFRASDTVNEITSATTFTVRRERWNIESTSTTNLNQTYANTYLGNAVAIDSTGNYAVAGAYNYGSPSSSSGKVTFLKRNGSSWTNLGESQSSDISLGDQFGYSLAIDGDLAIVGAWADDTGSSINNGSAYIFKKTNDVWSETAKLNGPASNNAFFGKSVAILGNVVFVGAPGFNSNTGKVLTYITSDGGTTWTAGLDYIGSVSGELFGETISVSLKTGSGSTLAVGSPGDSLSRGAVTVYDNDTDDWSTSGSATVNNTKLTGSYDASGDKFGQALQVVDDSLIVGVPFSDFNTLEGGLAYNFVYNTVNSTWSEDGIIQPDSPNNYDHFGSSVSISNTSQYPANTTLDTVLVGAPNANGAVYGFYWSTQNNRYEHLTKMIGGVTGNSAFGTSVAVVGNYGLIGAINKDNGAGVSNVGEIIHVSLG